MRNVESTAPSLYDHDGVDMPAAIDERPASWDLVTQKVGQQLKGPCLARIYIFRLPGS